MAITEKEAEYMYRDSKVHTFSKCLEIWRGDGFIKKSKLEEAREYTKRLCTCWDDNVTRCNSCLTSDKYEKAFKELQEMEDE
jgi:hypothetical protein